MPYFEQGQTHTPFERPIYPKVAMWREAFKRDDMDIKVFHNIKQLQEYVEPLDNWKRIKEDAKKEIKELPDDVLTQLFDQTAPFIDALPAAHSKGHLARDLVHLTEILHDPEMKNQDDVEILVGIFGGIFHDIGNSVVERYEEKSRIAGHAQVGAYLFGELAKNILPPNLLKLTQLTIAAHTNYPNPVTITKKNVDYTRQPYDTEIVAGNKEAIQTTQVSDRLEIQSVMHPIRHLLAVSEPIEIHAQGEFFEAKDDEKEEFKRQFSRDPKRKDVALGEMQRLATSVGNVDWYTKNDDTYVTNLFKEKVVDLQGFIDTVMDEMHPEITIQKDQKEAFEKYYKLARLLEPGIDIERKIQKLQEKFPLLGDEQTNWAAGFKVLTDQLYPKLYAQMRERIKDTPQFIQERQPKVQTIITDLHKKANTVLDTFDPTVLEKPQNEWPDVMDALVK